MGHVSKAHCGRGVAGVVLVAACLVLAVDALRRDVHREEDLNTGSVRDTSSPPTEGVSELGAEDVELQGESAGDEPAKQEVALSVLTPLPNQIQIARQRATAIAKAFNGSWSAIRKAGGRVDGPGDDEA